MVLTSANFTSFFENSTQMEIIHKNIIQLKSEGIDGPYDLVDLYVESISNISNRFRRPGGRLRDLIPGDFMGANIPTTPFSFGAKSQSRIIVAFHLARLYDAVGRDVESTNILWGVVIKNF